RPSSSASNRAPNSSTLHGPAPGSITHLDVSNPVVPIAEKPPTSDSKPSTYSKDPAGAKTEAASFSIAGVNGDQKASPSLSAMSRPVEPLPAREDIGPSGYNNISNNSNTHNATKIEPGPNCEPSSTAPQPKGRSSKNSTPVLPSFPESSQLLQPQRTTRPRGGTMTATDGGGPGATSATSSTGTGTGTTTTKRSHKKGAGLVAAAQHLIAEAATEDEDSSRQGDDEEDEGEPRYCYCNQVSFGEMVACDNETCPREWFHLSCVGLSRAPLKSCEFNPNPPPLSPIPP
ncbi:hypothetical protein ACJ72_08736, partial [Emergomyces africanus]